MVWKSSKQSIVADSMAEAEYIAASEGLKEAVSIKKFVEEIGVVPSVLNPKELYCYNSGVVTQAKEPRSHMKTRVVKHRYHIIRQHRNVL